MAGLDPAIHDDHPQIHPYGLPRCTSSWMRGSGPRMTLPIKTYACRIRHSPRAVARHSRSKNDVPWLAYDPAIPCTILATSHGRAWPGHPWRTSANPAV